MSKVPRVAHLLSQRPGWTGSGVALDALVRAADAAGWEQIAVVGTPAEDPTPAVGDLDRSQIHPLLFETPQLPFAVPGMSDVMPYRSSRFSELSDEQLAAYRDAWRDHLRPLLQTFRPDVIHVHHVWLLSSLVKELAPAARVVTHCHGTGLRQAELCPRLADEVHRGCARNDAFAVLHQDHRDTLAERMDVDPRRIHIVGSGYREELFSAEDRSSTPGASLVYAGKLSEAKGVPWLLEAVERMAERTPQVVLHVAGAGSGPEADRIRQRLEACPQVQFHGQVDQVRLAQLFRQSHTFVLPSFYEGLPLVLVEAAACGCRLVATALPGVVQQLAPPLGDALTLVPLPRLTTDQPHAADLPAFMDALQTALENSLEKPPLTDVAQRVSAMTWSAVFTRIEAIWKP